MQGHDLTRRHTTLHPKRAPSKFYVAKARGSLAGMLKQTLEQETTSTNRLPKNRLHPHSRWNRAPEKQSFDDDFSDDDSDDSDDVYDAMR